MEIIEKVPFEANGHDLEVWIFRNPLAGEFVVHVRQDSSRVAFHWPDGSMTVVSYTVSFETEFDARIVTRSSAVARAIEAAKSDAFTMRFEKARQNG